MDSTVIPSTLTLNSLQKPLFSLFKLLSCESDISVINQSSLHTKTSGECMTKYREFVTYLWTSVLPSISQVVIFKQQNHWKLCNLTGVNAILWQQTHMWGKIKISKADRKKIPTQLKAEMQTDLWDMII